MLNRRVGAAPTWRRSWPALAAALLLLAASPARAQAPAVSLGAGLQTSFVTTKPDDGDAVAQFQLNSARLYVGGTVTPKIKFMFNTEYDGVDSKVMVIDAAAQIAVSPKFNLWMGRFLPPSDRANLYGPYYSHHWAVYTDGIQDGYPFKAVGRDNGVMYWGQYGKVKVAAGAFDGATTTGNTDVLTAARVMVDLWDAEDGYYLNGTYYGGKNLLAIGGAVQAQDGNTASSVDFLLEKKLADGGAFTIESEYANYDKLGGYDSKYANSDGAYVLAAYLLGKPVGMGKIEFLGKFAKANFEKGLTIANPDYDQKTTEINVNYLIKEFNARIMFFFKNTNYNAVRRDFIQGGVGLQIQM
jgi:hypothetical protein